MTILARANDSVKPAESESESESEAQSFADALLSAVDFTTFDAAWNEGYQLGEDGEEDAQPPAEWAEPFREVWLLGFEAGCNRRWADYAAWCDAYQRQLDYASGRAFPDREYEEQEACRGGWHFGIPSVWPEREG